MIHSWIPFICGYNVYCRVGHKRNLKFIRKKDDKILLGGIKEKRKVVSAIFH